MTKIPYYSPRGSSPQEHLDYWSIPEALTGCTLCWLRPVKHGYKMIRPSAGPTVQAHRLAYELAKGPIPRGMFVCHRCDNPACVNPDHLFLGTHQDNMDDMHNKGRHRAVKGIQQWSAKLTDQIALAIFQDHRPNIVIARAYRISDVMVSRIKRRVSWKHIHAVNDGL